MQPEMMFENCLVCSALLGWICCCCWQYSNNRQGLVCVNGQWLVGEYPGGAYTVLLMLQRLDKSSNTAV